MIFSDKKIILYGDKKLKEDFEYIFEKVKIQECIDDNNYQKILNEDLNNIIVLVCDKNSEKMMQQLKDIGLEYNKHFFLAKDFFCNLLFFKNKKTIIWGTGKASQVFIDSVKCEFDYYIDSNIQKKDTVINDKPIRYSKKRENLENKYIIVGSSFYDEIKKELLELGLEEEKDFIYYEEIIKFLDMFDKFVSVTEKKNIYCNYPFTVCDVYFGGKVCICCFTEKYPIGNIKRNNLKQMWNSVYAKMIRRSVINKTFCYCNSECHMWGNDYGNDTIESEFPNHVNTEIDYTCNLMCTQCRNGMKIAKGKEYEEMDFIADRIIEDILPNVKGFGLAGNGEVFFSKAYRKILKSKNLGNLNNFLILSNGILFTEENWNIIKQHNINDLDISFSIDAATKQTYEKLRKGGNFDVLMKNLEFAAELRIKKEIKSLRLGFVIQRENFKEMSEFVRLAKSMNVDRVNFTRIRNCVGYSEEEFSKISMYDKNDEPLEELKQILLDSIFKDSIVNLSMGVLK